MSILDTLCKFQVIYVTYGNVSNVCECVTRTLSILHDFKEFKKITSDLSKDIQERSARSRPKD